MGKKRTPTAIRLLRGNPGKKPLPENEPTPPAEIPPPPTHLSPEALQEWNEMAPVLHAIGVLTTIDKAVLAAYCTSYAIWQRAWTAINEMSDAGEIGSGLMIKTSNGNLIQNPLLGTANKASVDMIKYASELGMTPSARSKVKANPGKNAKPEDEFFK